MHAANDKDKGPTTDLAFELKSFEAGQYLGPRSGQGPRRAR